MFVSMGTLDTHTDMPPGDRLRRSVAAHAREEEARAIRAGVTEEDPFAGFGLEGDAPMNGNGRNYLSKREAAARLRLSPRTLERYRVSGKGPVFHRFGSRVRYLPADLEVWDSARRRVPAPAGGGTGRRTDGRGLRPI